LPCILNQYQQAVGSPVPDWHARPAPQRRTIEGRHCRLEPLDAARHAADLHGAYCKAQDGRDWTYMPQEPFADESGYRRHLADAAASADPLHYAVLDLKDGRAIGTLALMRIDASHGVVEVGMVMFSPDLQRTPVSTEAQYLLMKYVFEELGYRRYEWKCDSLNEPSRRAAARLGFQYEGTFRQARVYKGRNRDTAWFSVIDSDWPALRAAFDAWLSPRNFDANGRQRLALSALRAASGPAA
jgi:RimJ/RimL family protein N-acetyltransferase